MRRGYIPGFGRRLVGIVDAGWDSRQTPAYFLVVGTTIRVISLYSSIVL